MAYKFAAVQDVAGKRFDFVIIGGGTAGLCLANRLSEDARVSVAVLEAGQAHLDDPKILKPLGWLQQAWQPDYDWSFPLAPQSTCDTSKFFWNRGKGLGGSSSMNMMLWTRPQREDIDALEKLGNPGWNWETFYKYMKKSESFIAAKEPLSSDYLDLHRADALGHDGPVRVSFAQATSGMEVPIQQSLKLLGVETISDSMSGKLMGTFKSMSSLDPATGTRSSATTAYLLPVLERPNLKVLPEAPVTRLITETVAGELVTTAVEFEHGETVHRVLVGKEAIVCAGTIQSPQILELSGIGDQKILEPLGITVNKHLPTVGQNLQDHVIFVGFVQAMRENVKLLTSDAAFDEKLLSRLRESGLQIDDPQSLCITGCTFLPLQAFSDRTESILESIKLTIAQKADQLPPGLKEQYEVLYENLAKSDFPAIEIVVFPFNAVPPVEGDGDSKPIGGQIPSYPVLMPSIQHPLSRGTVHITSPDPKKVPSIDPHYLEEEADLDVLVDIFKFTRKMSQMDPFQKLVGAEIAPGPKVETDEDIRAHIKKYIYTTWHSCGTCSMLPQDKGGVVDSKLKVYGTSNIRVVDMSIVPLIPSIHTQPVAYGIAEMAADIIKAAYA
ncbi:GMC oxidoreductase [Fomitopsis betulina]|nr:GMC oxidoreductase [Fomitopsis betulina]